MRVAVYARVSTARQAQAQTIEQQLDRLRAAVTGRGWELDDQHVYRDDGYSGASLGRPGLDRLRDHAALADLDVVLVTAPDRLARNYVHQVLLLEELARHGCRVEFLDRPMSTDPHDQLLLQIRGAVAEYERTLIAERMRRGRLAKLRAGVLLPWTRPPFGYRLGPERPRDPAAVRAEPSEAALVVQMFGSYLEPRVTLYQLAKRLTDLGVATPTGKPRWNAASVRGILRNPAYAGRAQTNRTGSPRPGSANPRCCRSARAKATRHARRRSGSKSRCRRSSPRKPSPRCRPSWIPTSRPRRATPGMSTCCAPWSAAEPAGWGASPGKTRQATSTTCAAATPTRCERPRASGARPATSRPDGWTSWSGLICARC